MARHCRAMSAGIAGTDEARQTLAKRIGNDEHSKPYPHHAHH